MTASPPDADNRTRRGDADTVDWDSIDWEQVRFVCVLKRDRPGPGWWGAFIVRVPWIRAAVIAAAVAAGILAALLSLMRLVLS